MTFTTSAVLSPSAPSLWDRLSSLRDVLTQHAAQRRAYRTALAELGALSDRDLSDLGLVRADIARVAIEASRT